MDHFLNEHFCQYLPFDEWILKSSLWGMWFGKRAICFLPRKEHSRNASFIPGGQEGTFRFRRSRVESQILSESLLSESAAQLAFGTSGIAWLRHFKQNCSKSRGNQPRFLCHPSPRVYTSVPKTFQPRVLDEFHSLWISQKGQRPPVCSLTMSQQSLLTHCFKTLSQPEKFTVCEEIRKL